MRFGIDFDNTLVCYDDILFEIASQRCLVPADCAANKKAIRDRVRGTINGELEWQRLQAEIYGPAMSNAVVMPGALEFLRQCRRRGIGVRIISHKTPHAAADPSGADLREAAFEWLVVNRLVNGDEFGLSTADVHFESSRRDKIGRIQACGCTHFIDDLEETFSESAFPSSVQAILFDPHRQYSPPPGTTRVTNWNEIGDIYFDDCD